MTPSKTSPFQIFILCSLESSFSELSLFLFYLCLPLQSSIDFTSFLIFKNSSFIFPFYCKFSIFILLPHPLPCLSLSFSPYSLNFFPLFWIFPLQRICCGFNHCLGALKSSCDWHFLPERRRIWDCGKLTTKTQHIQFSAQYFPFFQGAFAWD